MGPDEARLRATVEHLEKIERGSASPGEREAAEWIAARLRELGCRDARVEEERAHGTYWVPLGLLCGAGALAGLAAGGGGPLRRAAAALVGAAAAAGIADDVSAGPHVLRRFLPHRTTYNVVAETGDPDGEQILVFGAHHDAAHGGFVFTPELVTIPADAFPRWYDAQQTSPQIMLVVAAGPVLVALGAASGIGFLRRIGTLLSAGSFAAFADIATRSVVPGANDNLTAVAALVELARSLRDEPVRGVRVILLSTGSEESFMEGMRGFARRHLASMPRDRTRFICLESLGAPELIVIEGEGMLRMADYPEESRDFLADCAQRAGHPLRRGLRLGLATDGLIALRAGIRTAVLASVTKYKFPSNYHLQKDVAHNVDFGTVAAAVRVVREVVDTTARQGV